MTDPQCLKWAARTHAGQRVLLNFTTSEGQTKSDAGQTPVCQNTLRGSSTSLLPGVGDDHSRVPDCSPKTLLATALAQRKACPISHPRHGGAAR